MPAPHPPEFRQRAVDLARSKVKPIGEIARDLSISESCLRNWLAQADADEGRSSSARLTGDEKRELAELRRKARRLEVENEILKRAAAYFARENVLPK
ncbi:MAG: transposase [Pseudonocardia sp.]